MLNEIELLVAGLDGEVFSIRCLVCSFGSERRIGQNYVVSLATKGS